MDKYWTSSISSGAPIWKASSTYENAKIVYSIKKSKVK
tara:strand:- start:60858 stop:60971 length:114 start_codon:yes stop_codon:yes gene_type:complete